MTPYLAGVRYYLPETIRSNEDLAAINPGWDAEKIYRKTGIRRRPIAGEGQTASDLGYEAASRLIEELAVDRARIDALLFCTQSPDYHLPTTACLLQDRLGLPTSCGALDFNLGCSGFTYGLWIARSLIQAGSAQTVLLVTADTYSKYCDVHDLATATIFGDAGAAALISSSPGERFAAVGQTVVGTDGRGAGNLIVRAGGARAGGVSPLFMNGAEIFSFTLGAVPSGVQRLLDRLSLGWDQIDVFLMHQANRFILESLRDTMRIPPEKLPIDLEDCGNTVSASIPILMRRCQERGLFKAGQRCVLVGFGVGYSWAMTELNIVEGK